MTRLVSKTQFLELLGQANLESVLAAAKQSVQIEAWVMRFNAASEVDLDYPETVQGLQALEAAQILSTGSAAAILGAEPTSSVSVTVKAPFDMAYPEVYAVIRQSANAWTLANGVEFHPDHLEVV